MILYVVDENREDIEKWGRTWENKERSLPIFISSPIRRKIWIDTLQILEAQLLGRGGDKLLVPMALTTSNPDKTQCQLPNGDCFITTNVTNAAA